MILLYADDTIIISDSQEDFQLCLDVLIITVIHGTLMLTFPRLKIMFFGAQQFRNFNFMFGGKQIEIVNHYHYLEYSSFLN